MDSAPRVCGDDPESDRIVSTAYVVLPAYAGMILIYLALTDDRIKCSPRMRG